MTALLEERGGGERGRREEKEEGGERAAVRDGKTRGKRRQGRIFFSWAEFRSGSSTGFDRKSYSAYCHITHTHCKPIKTY